MARYGRDYAGCHYLESLDLLGGDGLEPDPGGWVVLQHVPHVGLAQHEQVAVAHGPHTRRAPVPRRAHVQDAEKCLSFRDDITLFLI